MPPSAKVLVVGGGISGLACAWRLRQLGVPVLLAERSARFGGVISTVEKDGFRFDVGPQSLTVTPPLAVLIGEVALTGELLHVDRRAPRYILFRGRPVPAPLRPPDLLRTPLLGWSSRLRLLREPFRRTRPPEADESLAAFVRRKFGEDVLANLAAPAVSGVFAGDPEKLSLRSAFPSVYRWEREYGSVIRGAMKARGKGGGGSTLSNFPEGVAQLIAAIAGRLSTSPGCAAELGIEAVAIRRAPDPSAGFEVSCSTAGGAQQVQAGAIVVAAPTRQAAALLAPIEPAFADVLARIPYACMNQVSAGYRLSQITRLPGGKPRGFGFLVPRGEGLRLLGTVFSSFLFPGRAPAGPEAMASFTSFLGGATDPAICAEPEDAVAALAHAELSRVLGIEGDPVAQNVARWKRAIPQYNLGHEGIVADLTQLCAATPGIFLAGNYLGGPAVGSCVEQANRTAEDAARFLAAQG